MVRAGTETRPYRVPKETRPYRVPKEGLPYSAFDNVRVL